MTDKIGFVAVGIGVVMTGCDARTVGIYTFQGFVTNWMDYLK